MTVKELMQMLIQMPMDAEIEVALIDLKGNAGISYTIENIGLMPNENVVYIEIEE